MVSRYSLFTERERGDGEYCSAGGALPAAAFPKLNDIGSSFLRRLVKVIQMCYDIVVWIS